MASLPLRRPSTLLELDLTELPVEPEADDPMARLLTRSRRQLRPTLRALYEAADDPKVVGLIAKVGSGLPWAPMQELRRGVMAFAASGKPTVAWAESFGEGPGDLSAYVLASAFGEIWLQPGGGVGLLGVGLQTTFLRGVLDRLGIEPQLEQRYEYKNAADRFERREFTPAHRESMEQLAESIFADAVADIAASRGQTPERLHELIDTGPRTAGEALAAGLVDRLGYRDQVYAAVRERAVPEAELLFADRWQPGRRLRLPARRRDHVALVEIRGTIGSGRTRRGMFGRQVGSDSVGAQLRAAIADDHARAVLLRIDSPGGSAAASDTIWREVTRVRESGRPVVVSMGSTAASGGYYVACPAEVIVAAPATLTGSIGVLAGKFVAAELLDRIGVSTGTVERGARALMFSARRRFTDDERERLAATIDAIYADFVAKVAAGRHRPVAEIEAVARGRVWTGRDALAVGLVDELGGMHEATVIARTRAGLPEDAPVLPALHVPPVARLARPRNSEDPRAWVGLAAPALDDVAAALGVPAEFMLRMADIRLPG